MDFTEPLDELLKLAENYRTYLGIKVGRKPSSLYHFNYLPLIARIIRELQL